MDNFIIVRTSMSFLWRPRLRRWTICDDFPNRRVWLAEEFIARHARINDLVAERLCWCSSRDRPIRAFGSIFLDAQNHLQRWNSVVDRDNTGSPHLAHPTSAPQSPQSPGRTPYTRICLALGQQALRAVRAHQRSPHSNTTSRVTGGML